MPIYDMFPISRNTAPYRIFLYGLLRVKIQRFHDIRQFYRR